MCQKICLLKETIETKVHRNNFFELYRHIQREMIRFRRKTIAARKRFSRREIYPFRLEEERDHGPYLVQSSEIRTERINHGDDGASTSHGGRINERNHNALKRFQGRLNSSLNITVGKDSVRPQCLRMSNWLADLPYSDGNFSSVRSTSPSSLDEEVSFLRNSQQVFPRNQGERMNKQRGYIGCSNSACEWSSAKSIPVETKQQRVFEELEKCATTYSIRSEKNSLRNSIRTSKNFQSPTQERRGMRKRNECRLSQISEYESAASNSSKHFECSSYHSTNSFLPTPRVECAAKNVRADRLHEALSCYLKACQAPNVSRDFVAAMDYIVMNSITTAHKLVTGETSTDAAALKELCSESGLMFEKTLQKMENFKL